MSGIFRARGLRLGTFALIARRRGDATPIVADESFFDASGSVPGNASGALASVTATPPAANAGGSASAFAALDDSAWQAPTATALGDATVVVTLPVLTMLPPAATATGLAAAFAALDDSAWQNPTATATGGAASFGDMPTLTFSPAEAGADGGAAEAFSGGGGGGAGWVIWRGGAKPDDAALPERPAQPVPVPAVAPATLAAIRVHAPTAIARVDVDSPARTPPVATVADAKARNRAAAIRRALSLLDMDIAA